MKTTRSKDATFTNKQKEFLCRLVLLAPIVSIMFIFLVLLVCMEMLAVVKEPRNCHSLNCTVRFQDASLGVTCGNIYNSTSITSWKCLALRLRCMSYGTVNDGRKLASHHNTWKRFGLCFNDLRESDFIKNSSVLNAADLVRELLTKDRTPKNCSLLFDKAKVSSTACKIGAEAEEPEKKRLQENTRIADVILVVLLSIGLSVFLLMCVYTRKILKLCCHLCYDDEMN